MTYAHDEGASQYERNAAALTFDPQTSARTRRFGRLAASAGARQLSHDRERHKPMRLYEIALSAHVSESLGTALAD